MNKKKKLLKISNKISQKRSQINIEIYLKKEKKDKKREMCEMQPTQKNYEIDFSSPLFIIEKKNK